MSEGGNFVGFNPTLLRVEDLDDAHRILFELGCDKMGVSIMGKKANHFLISIENVSAPAAGIIKQVMLSNGGECATPRSAILGGSEKVRVIMMGTRAQLEKAAKNLALQPFGLRRLSSEIKELLGVVSDSNPKREMPCGRHLLRFGERTIVMGIINVTPDSFSDGGRFMEYRVALGHARQMAEAGVDVIDVGGESTRPGSEPVDLKEELRRTIPLVEAIASELGVPISIDTTKAEVARRAVDAGASIINDVSGLRFDERMVDVVRDSGAAIVIMHMQGTPKDMQDNPRYEDVVRDICRFFRERTSFAISKGVDAGKIIIDPGIGFGKNLEHNLEIIRRIEEFRSLGFPILLGPSRKRFIGDVLGKPTEERMLGSAATIAFAISRGVDMVRVHDVREMLEVTKMADALSGKCRKL